MRVMLLGYYGFKNIGDDLMLLNLLDYLVCRPDIKRISVYCRNRYYPEMEKVSYVSNTGFGRILLPIELLSADHVMWGGGTCLYDAGDNSGMRWIRRQQLIASLGRSRFSFLGIGIGDLSTTESFDLARTILTGSSYAYFREESSMKFACETLSYQNAACVGGDLFLLNAERLSKGSVFDHSKNIDAISFSGLYGLDENSAELYALVLSDIIQKYGSTIHFLPAHQGCADDNIYHLKIATHLPSSKYVMHSWENPKEFVDILANMNFHIGMRLHSVVCADLLGIPNLAIAYAPKVKLYVEKSGILPDVRVVPVNDPFSVERIIAISQSYRRPDEFLLAESMKARECLDKMFH